MTVRPQKTRKGALVSWSSSVFRLATPVCVGVWVLIQQLSGIPKPFRGNMAAIVLLYTPSAKTTRVIFKEYADELARENLKHMISKLKERKFSHTLCTLSSLLFLDELLSKRFLN